jgi:hypothetical protein
MDFFEEIKSMNDVEVLTSFKKDIQDRITQPMHWTERMDLYTEVQLINKQIQEINNRKQL